MFQLIGERHWSLQFTKKGNIMTQQITSQSHSQACHAVLEHIIANSTKDHLETNKILYDSQHGFGKCRSCETQLLELLEELTK